MPRGRDRKYVAMIGDMVDSRELPSSRRPLVQKHFQELMAGLNREYRNELAARFAITLGDEFQALFQTSIVLPDVIWKLEEDFPDRLLRVGIGSGTLDTPLQRYAINIDGPALHHAREAIEIAAKQKILGGVFRGFGNLDEVLSGVARLLYFHRSRWTRAQRKIINRLRRGMSQSEVADQLRVSRQVISKQVASAGWVAYHSAESAWRIILQDYVDPMIGPER
jgi:SatD family (SatD)